MIKDDWLKEFPTRRIKPEDGMAVTAQVWEEAHSYHDRRQQYHDLLRHGPGIVTGLEVIASDPPDSSVYILPGMAVDPRGEVIVLTEPVAYDVGSAHGLLYLMLTYEESRPTADHEQEEGPRYVHGQFGVEARPSLPDAPHVELARLRRRDREGPLVNARDAEHPGPNEIDLRFRPGIGAASEQVVPLAVSYTGGLADAGHGRGAGYLARALRRSGQKVWVDDHVPLAPGLEGYTLAYLVGQDAFQLNRDEMNALYTLLQGGGTVLIESCRNGIKAGDPAADASFLDLLASMGVQLQELKTGHELLVNPYLFAAPPPGFEMAESGESAGKVLAGEGVVFSTCDYGCLWRGERRGRAASREEIRTAMEWGSNIVAYAVERHRKAKK
jgi:hypothetical protein